MSHRHVAPSAATWSMRSIRPVRSPQPSPSESRKVSTSRQYTTAFFHHTSLVGASRIRQAYPGGSAAGRLEELDRVAGRIVQHDLLPAGAGDDVVAERQAGGAQAGDL